MISSRYPKLLVNIIFLLKIEDIMRLHSRDMAMKMLYRSLLERLGSVEYTRATLDKYDSKLRQEVSFEKYIFEKDTKKSF